MKKNLKQAYLAPLTQMFTVIQKGVVCASPAYAPKFNKPFSDEEEW